MLFPLFLLEVHPELLPVAGVGAALGRVRVLLHAPLLELLPQRFSIAVRKRSFLTLNVGHVNNKIIN